MSLVPVLVIGRDERRPVCRVRSEQAHEGADIWALALERNVKRRETFPRPPTVAPLNSHLLQNTTHHYLIP